MLEGIKVLDFSLGASGPFCTRLLADWGARVIKVEKPGGEITREWDSVVNGLSSAHVWLNRNKESITLNLKKLQARELVYSMVKDTDVVVENFAPGVVKKLGIDYETLRKFNPRIIYCHISGYGQDGPYRDEKAFDLIMQGETGLILMTGSPDEPAKISLSICDIGAGMYAALGIAMALYNRASNPTGGGQELEVSMFDSILSMLGYFPHFYWYRGELPARVGTRHHLLTPYGPYKSKDDKYVNLACLSKDHWQKLCNEVLSRPDFLLDPRFKNNEERIRNREVLERNICDEIAKLDREEWLIKLRAAGIPCGRVNDLGGALNHPQTIHRGLIRMIDTPHGKVKEIDNPIRSSRYRSRMNYIPGLGEHTLKILSELGISSEEINNLKQNGVV